MKKLLTTVFSIAFVGCASLTMSDVNRIAAGAKEAATSGTREVLLSHPEWKPQFQLAADQLHTLATSPDITVQSILAIAKQLPVKELKSQDARIAFEAATFTISIINVPPVPAEAAGKLQPIAQAIADGINAGLN